MKTKKEETKKKGEKVDRKNKEKPLFCSVRAYEHRIRQPNGQLA